MQTSWSWCVTFNWRWTSKNGKVRLVYLLQSSCSHMQFAILITSRSHWNVLVVNPGHIEIYWWLCTVLLGATVCLEVSALPFINFEFLVKFLFVALSSKFCSDIQMFIDWVRRKSFSLSVNSKYRQREMKLEENFQEQVGNFEEEIAHLRHRCNFWHYIIIIGVLQCWFSNHMVKFCVLFEVIFLLCLYEIFHFLLCIHYFIFHFLLCIHYFTVLNFLML